MVDLRSAAESVFAPAECVPIAPSLRVFPSDFAPAECVPIAPSLRVFVFTT